MGGICLVWGGTGPTLRIFYGGVYLCAAGPRKKVWRGGFRRGGFFLSRAFPGQNHWKLERDIGITNLFFFFYIFQKLFTKYEDLWCVLIYFVSYLLPQFLKWENFSFFTKFYFLNFCYGEFMGSGGYFFKGGA